MELDPGGGVVQLTVSQDTAMTRPVSQLKPDRQANVQMR